MSLTCIHCHVRKPGNGNRGLCRACHDRPEIRGLYPAKVDVSYRTDPTAAELDALIAERSKALPPWWAEEARKERMR